LGDTTLKVAMLLSLSRDLSLEIGPDAMQEAINECVGCLDGLRLVTMGQQGAEFGNETAIILRELLNREGNQVTRRVLLSKFWGRLDAPILDRIMETLVGAGAVEADRIGKDVIYTMPLHVVQRYQNYKKEIN